MAINNYFKKRQEKKKQSQEIIQKYNQQTDDLNANEIVRDEADIFLKEANQIEFKKSEVGKIYKNFSSDISYYSLFEKPEKIKKIIEECKSSTEKIQDFPDIEVKDLLLPFLVEKENLRILNNYEKQTLNNICERYGNSTSDFFVLLLVKVIDSITNKYQIDQNWGNYFPSCVDVITKYKISSQKKKGQ